VFAWKLPDAQAVHTLEEAEPVAEEEVPALQPEQVDDVDAFTTTEKVPAAQSAQSEESEAIETKENFPAAQSTQLVWPVSDWYWPASHTEQLGVPELRWYFPTTQSAQLEAPLLGETLPGGQLPQASVTSPVAARNKPDEQAVQSEAPPLVW
jgi:hypothetical protein